MLLFCLQKTKPRSSASANVLLVQFSEYALNAGGWWTGDLFKADTEDLKTLPHLKVTYKNSIFNEVDIQKRDNEIALPCRVGEILQEGQPFSTAVFQAGGDVRQEFQGTLVRGRKKRKSKAIS